MSAHNSRDSSTTYIDPELDLLGDDPNDVDSGGDNAAAAHSLKTAPVFTGHAYELLGHTILPQRALYGRLISQHASALPEKTANPKLFINTNAPFSALVCGVQGSGKSHSTSVLLESCLMQDERIGTLPQPLSALVFHFDTAAGGGLVQPCEAAYLSALNTNHDAFGVPPSVTVLVVPTYLQAMRRVYAGLPQVNVQPLLFAPEDISGERLLSMMKVDENAQMPLYMEAIMVILRSMEDQFDYAEFRKRLDEQRFNPSQKSMLKLRLSLLDSCLNGGNEFNRVSTHFKKGQLTIIDLSSPFMDGSSACGFFDMILGLFIETDVNTAGKIVVLDEAHKYLSESQSGSSAKLTDSLLSVIRQQRHLATRVVISTQEPTVVPRKFLDLCSFIIAHRFSSPSWLDVLAQHVSAAGRSMEDLLSQLVSLSTGHAIMFAANALVVRTQAEHGGWGDNETVGPLGQGYFIVRSRFRITRDGGQSLLAVEDTESGGRIRKVSGRHGSPASVDEQRPEHSTESGTSRATAPLNPLANVFPAPGVVPATSWETPELTLPEVHASVPDATDSIAGDDIFATVPARIRPLLHFIHSQLIPVGRRRIPRAELQAHFLWKQPTVYGTSPSAIDNVIMEGISSGFLEEVIRKGRMVVQAVTEWHKIMRATPLNTSTSLLGQPPMHGIPLQSLTPSSMPLSTSTAVPVPEASSVLPNTSSVPRRTLPQAISIDTPSATSHFLAPSAATQTSLDPPSNTSASHGLPDPLRDVPTQVRPLLDFFRMEILPAGRRRIKRTEVETYFMEKHPAVYEASQSAIDAAIAEGISRGYLVGKTKKANNVLRVAKLWHEIMVTTPSIHTHTPLSLSEQRPPQSPGNSQHMTTPVASSSHTSDHVLLLPNQGVASRINTEGPTDNLAMGSSQSEEPVDTHDGTESNPPHIYLFGTLSRFTPLVQFVSAQPSGSVGLSRVQHHFLKTNPDLYGRKLKEFYALTAEAQRHGVLSVYCETKRPTIALVPHAIYHYD